MTIFASPGFLPAMRAPSFSMASCPGWLNGCLLVAAVLLAPLPGSAITLRVEQVGADVVVTGSGSANTQALTLADTRTDFSNVLTEFQVYAGPAANDDGQVGLWSGITGPSTINGNVDVTAVPGLGSTGDLFGIVADAGSGSGLLVLPDGYTSGASLSGTSRFLGYTLAELGLSPGVTLTWNWGSGSTADSLELQVMNNGTPVPVPLPLAGAAYAWKSSRKLRRVYKRSQTFVSGSPVSPG